MKTIWKGSISFGLVTIDVALFAAIKEHVLGFSLLHSICKHPIKYKRWCDHCKKEVMWDETVKGFKIARDKYVILSKELINRFKPETTSLLTIHHVVATDSIPVIYFNQHYYVAPINSNDHAFLLLCTVLAEQQKSAIGTFVMREKSHVCSLTAYGSVLVLSTLHYLYEIRTPIKLKSSSFSMQEHNLARQLIEIFTVEKFDITDFKDTFAQKLIANIKKAKPVHISGAASRKVVSKKTVAPQQEKHISLRASLEQSLKNIKEKKKVT